MGRTIGGAFWNALFDGQVVTDEWVAEMSRAHSEVPENHGRYGLGFWLAETGTRVMLVGSDPGVSFCSTHDPATGRSWTVMSNTTDGAWPMVRQLRVNFTN